MLYVRPLCVFLISTETLKQ